MVMQMNPKQITVLLADDHAVVREGIRHILANFTDISIVGEAQNGSDVKKLVVTLRPTVLLLDLKMPGASPFEIEKWIRENYPETITLVLTAHDRDFYLSEMMDAGVAGYLNKNEKIGSLVTAIRRAASGRTFFTSEQIDRAIKWRREVGNKWQKLTKREREILFLVAQGQSNKAIADQLGITLKTVAFHVSKILNQIDLESRAEATAWLRKYFPEDLE